MKKFLPVFSTISLTLLLICFVGVVGCEDDDDDNNNTSNVQLIPASTTIPAGTSSNVAMSVLNGTAPYTWTISDNSLGSLTVAGSTAIYASNTNAGQQTVTIVDAQTNSASAGITHN